MEVSEENISHVDQSLKNNVVKLKQKKKKQSKRTEKKDTINSDTLSIIIIIIQGIYTAHQPHWARCASQIIDKSK